MVFAGGGPGPRAPQFALGLRYDCGSGVARDYEAAFAWYLRAARQGHARAQFNLGLMHASGQGARRDLLAAYAWLLQAARGGECAAQAYLARVSAHEPGATVARGAPARRIARRLRRDWARLLYILTVQGTFRGVNGPARRRPPSVRPARPPARRTGRRWRSIPLTNGAAPRALLARRVAPELVHWTGPQDHGELFARAALAPPLRIGRKLMGMLEGAACCRAPQRWALLYRVLWRWQQGDHAVLSAADRDGARLHAMVRAVRRAERDMHARIRFRERRADAGPPRFVAWFEPAHDVLPRVARHFMPAAWAASAG
ncbi:DUF4130 domain-containing protein [Massilia sp. B-10]|nr:DUF4130 domain-containing protein [Massilia sp. B-10]